MAGGSFANQNKVLPAAYVNVVNASKPTINDSDRGVVFTITQGLAWGADGLVTVNGTSNFTSLFGVPITDPALAGLYQVLQRATQVLVFNFNAGTAATGSSAVLPWDFTAKYGGTKGNNISVSVQPNAANPSKYDIQTFYNSDLVDIQSVSAASQLVANDFIVPTILSSVTDDGAALLGALSSSVLITLTGATDVTSPTQTDDLLQAIETQEFNVLTAAGQAPTAAIHQLFATTAIRLRDSEGRKIQAVIPAISGYDPDHEGVIVLANGVQLADGTVLTPTVAAGFVAGATAAAEPNQSLTYTVFPSAIDAVPRYNEDEQIANILAGNMAFIAARNVVKIQTDINSLHTYTDTKSADMSKNRVLRVLDDIANSIRESWEDNFIGKVTNNENGLDLFKAACVSYLTTLQNSGAIMDFDPTKDIAVSQGNTKDSVVADITVIPTDAMEKLYLTIYAN